MVTNTDYELILGARRDKDFGSIILFGQGGRGVEFIQDFSMALPPLNQTLARRMMEETRIYQALTEGIRERAPVNMQTLEEIVSQFSNMIADFPEIAEFEINPLSAHRNEVQALDARMVVDPNTREDQNPHPHLMILPYPTKYVTPWRLRDGTEALLRPIRPEDEKFESEFVKGLSNETKRFRFFRIFKDLSHIDLSRFCNIDYDREIAIIAEHREGERKREIGAATLIIETDRNCGEIGVVVADRFQRKGLGTKLMDMIIGIAEERGLEHIYGIILPENESMLRICKKMGFAIKKTAEESIATLNLK